MKKQSEYQAKYDAANTKRYGLKLSTKYDTDIIEKLQSVESMQGYIKQLIKTDITLSPFLRAISRKDAEGYEIEEAIIGEDMKTVRMAKGDEMIDVIEHADGNAAIEQGGKVIEVYGKPETP